MSDYWSEVAHPDGVRHKQLSRIEVPGGWVYKLDGGGMCFVPAPPPSGTITLTPSQAVDVDFREVDQKEEKAA